MSTFSFSWLETNSCRSYLRGDVRDVLQARANQLHDIPQTATHGFGALTDSHPKKTGEGIIVRNRYAFTPPDGDAGINVHVGSMHDSLRSPFWLGWSGSPSAGIFFENPSGSTLREIYQHIFNHVFDEKCVDHPLIAIELTGLFFIKNIYDRALRLPVCEGNTNITSPENAPHYFRFNVIQGTEKEKKSQTQQLTLSVVGAALQLRNSQKSNPALQYVEKCVFYTPPSTTNQPNASSSLLTTHSHALAWETIYSQPDEHLFCEQGVDDFMEDYLAQTPCYMLHLDEWSLVEKAWINLYLLDTPKRLP